MIQFNLLPDVKIQYIKARRQKRLVVLIASLATVVAVAVFIFLLLFVDVLQKKNLRDLSSDIKTNSSQLEGTADLSKILTVQNQLTSLAALHDQKPAVSRLFGFLTQLTPSAVSIANLQIDYTQHTLSISGSADALATVHDYTDTLKSATYTVNGSSAKAKSAFSNIVLSNFSRSDKGATYTVTMNFDPTLFAQKSDVSLSVQSSSDTHSDASGPLFINDGTN